MSAPAAKHRPFLFPPLRVGKVYDVHDIANNQPKHLFTINIVPISMGGRSSGVEAGQTRGPPWWPYAAQGGGAHIYDVPNK